ncbi:uncharacterized protein HfgLR_01320 [Haloferax gibbonsii]|uniref:Uncharacterized protein n=1 Tax=Haloferax gibbonsii TaxID=35746 RepID=A0A871BBM8_HALGI|nr:uncharacterized protein HfgLR_01320 [Haloferax gibbonsii]
MTRDIRSSGEINIENIFYLKYNRNRIPNLGTQGLILYI